MGCSRLGGWLDFSLEGGGWEAAGVAACAAGGVLLEDVVLCMHKPHAWQPLGAPSRS